MRQRRTLKIASAPLRQRCQPRIVMRRHHSKGCRSLDEPYQRVNGPSWTIRLRKKGQSQAGDLCLLSNRTNLTIRKIREQHVTYIYAPPLSESSHGQYRRNAATHRRMQFQEGVKTCIEKLMGLVDGKAKWCSKFSDCS